MAEDTKDQTTAAPAAVEATDEDLAGLRMHVKVYAPFKVYYDDEAESISAVNATGPFDILPRHHNFMTLLNAGDIIVRSGGKEETIKISRGIMHVKADSITVFLDV